MTYNLPNGSIVYIRENVAIDHKNRIGHMAEIIADAGDVFGNGQQWYECQFADGERLHFMAIELDKA